MSRPVKRFLKYIFPAFGMRQEYVYVKSCIKTVTQVLHLLIQHTTQAMPMES